MNKPSALIIACAITAISGCQSVSPKVELPAPLSVGAKPERHEGITVPPSQAQRNKTGVSATPAPPVGSGGTVGLGMKEDMPPLGTEPIKASLDNMPLPAFINEVFGNLLKVNYVIDPALAKQSDLVTLRVTDPQTPEVFYRTARDVLRRYGIATTWDGQTLSIVPAKDAAGSEPPILISGRALPDVPESHRPVFQLVELHAVSNGDVSHWLRTAYNNSQLKVEDDIRRNAVMLSGPPDLVREAVKAIGILDRPFLKGSFSRRIEPAFVSADQLAPQIVQALRAEGYSADTQVSPGTAVVVLPVAAANSLLVFAPDEKTLDHVIQWAKSIDQPNPSSSKDSLFYYPVANTKASDIAAVLNGGRNQGGSNLTMGSTTPEKTGNSGSHAAGTSGNTSTDQDVGGSLMVDEPRNALIFRGDPAEWARLLPLVRQMDRAARQVMIEVTIAEVTLDNGASYGLSWLAKDSHGKFDGTWQMGTIGGSSSSSGSGSTSGSTSGGTTGLTYLVDVAGLNRAKLTAIAQDQRVTILSTPRLLVKSGDEASIDVGTEVPTITAQTNSLQQTNGNSNILQSIQYRKTGIILDVKPTVYSDNRIDLDISQEVSEAQAADTSSGVNSPSIFNRSIKTSLSLLDGGSVVLGGLVSDKVTTGNSGIPFLKDIPVIGNLFKSQSKQKTKTELLVMIVPYIIDSDQQAHAVTSAVVDSMPDLNIAPSKSKEVPDTKDAGGTQ